MITNQRQYRISQAQAKKFAQAIQAAETTSAPPGVHPRIHKAMIDGLQSQHEELASDLRAYEALREGKVRKRTLTSLLELPAVLIEGRIAKQMTQRQLADKLDLPEQQIQRYEASRYAGVSLERLQQIATAIGLRLRETIDFDLPTPERATRRTLGGSSAARRKTTQRSSRRRAKARPAAKRATAAKSSAKRSEGAAKRSTTKKTTNSKPAATRTTAKRTATKKTAARSTAKTATKRTSAKSRSSSTRSKTRRGR